MIKFVHLIDHDMQMMDFVIWAKNVQITSEKEKNWIYNIAIWLIHVHCVAYDFVNPREAIIIKMFGCVANLRIKLGQILYNCKYRLQQNKVRFLMITPRINIYIYQNYNLIHLIVVYTHSLYIIHRNNTLIRSNIVSKIKSQTTDSTIQSYKTDKLSSQVCNMTLSQTNKPWL